jgi:hypothetical protein
MSHIVARLLRSIPVLAVSSVIFLGATTLHAQPDPQKISLPSHAEEILKLGKGHWRSISRHLDLASERDSADMYGLPNGCLARVEIAPTVGSSAVSHNLVSKHRQGFVVARVVNLDSKCSVAKYALAPLDTAWWVVEIGLDDGAYRSRFISDGPNSGNEHDIGAAKGKRWHWTECPAHDPMKIDFARITYIADNCMYPLSSPETKPAAVRARLAAKSLAPKARKRMLDDLEYTFWFSCSQTCCYADDFQ